MNDNDFIIASQKMPVKIANHFASLIRDYEIGKIILHYLAKICSDYKTITFIINNIIEDNDKKQVMEIIDYVDGWGYTVTRDEFNKKWEIVCNEGD